MKLKKLLFTFGIIFSLVSCGAGQESGPLLESISLSGDYKVVYLVGEELDTDGLIVTAHYSDNSKKVVTDYTTSGFDSSFVGEKNVVVTYINKSAEYKITVKDNTPVLVSLSLSGSYKTEYLIGEQFDKTGLIVTANYSNGTREVITDYTVSGFDSSFAGEKIIVITYHNISTTYTINVEENVPTLVSIALSGTYKTEYAIGDELDATGLIVTATYSDESTTTVSLNDCTLTGFDSTSAGQKTITVTYQGKTKTYQVNVIATEYKLTLTINVSGTFTNFTNIKFAYNYDNSAEYNKDNTISTEEKEKYNFSIEHLSITKPVYFKLIVNDSVLGECFVGLAENANFSLTPSGDLEERLIISFTYPTSTNVIGVIGDDTSSKSMTFADQNTTVYGSKITINPTFDMDPETFTMSYTGENIRIEDNKYIIGLKAGTTTEVTLTSEKGLTCKFNVNVATSTYHATSTRDLLVSGGINVPNEKWFTSTTVSEISGMGSDFFNGIDISSAKALYDNGSKFYNSDGVEQSLFYILKDAGINWIRLKLWVDPYDSNGTSYGGGGGDLQSTLWMAHETKAAGLKLLLDLHYSDYWTHPGQQILPKAWAGASSANALATLIQEYTTETLNTFKDNDCLPDMVQLGNEISSGSFLQVGSTSATFDQYGIPAYQSSKSNFSYQGTSGSDNMKKYLKAASDGVNAVDSSIKKVIHWAKGSQINAGVINNFFNNLSTIDYDYAGISFYPYYCFDDISSASAILNGLNISNSKGSVPWFIAETSYPFTESWVYEEVSGAPTYNVTNQLITSYSSGITNIFSSYSSTMSGQANLIHDLTAAVVSAGGLGIFYWEGAWVPNAYVGWAGLGSSCSWSNQGFFSYNGKAIANLDLFKQMSPHI